MDGFDFDLDLDTDVETDVSLSHNVFGVMLKVVNAHDIPLMLILSLLTLFIWIVSILSNYYFNPSQSWLVALGLFFGNFIVSTILVNLVTQPLRPFMRELKKDEKHIPLVGSIGEVKSRVIDEKFGQVSIVRDGGSPALLNAKLVEGSLVRGETIVVVDYDEESKRYLVKSAPELKINKI